MLICKDGSGEAIWIELPSFPQKKIDWKEPLQIAENAKSKGQKIFWEFLFGLSDPFFPIEDEMRLQELSQVLKHFSENIYPRFDDASAGAALYRGPLDLTGCFLWSEKQKDNFDAWKEETGQTSKASFCLDCYAAYFQLLAYKLPDGLPIFALFDASGLRRAEALFLLSKESFRHFSVAAKGVGSLSWCLEWKGESLTSQEPRIGVVLPLECDLDEFEKELLAMDALGQPYRVVNEANITEEWDGLEMIVAGNLSPRGKRMLKGFIASGGVVEEVRGRGIRTPDLLVPNQPR